MKGKILLGLTAILMLMGAAVPVKADDWNMLEKMLLVSLIH